MAAAITLQFDKIEDINDMRIFSKNMEARHIVINFPFSYIS